MNLPTHSLRRLALVLSATATLLLGGCGALLAQNPSTPLKPVNAVAEGETGHLMLKGHDVVSYFTQGRHALGSVQHQSVYQGVTFRFASAEHKALFDQDPVRYAPQYGGFCANGIVYGIPWGGDADSWRIEGGKLYIFGGKGSKDGFELDVPGHIKLADKYWSDEVSGSNSFVQRTKRLIFRVPHYKNGDEIAKAVAEARARGQ